MSSLTPAGSQSQTLLLPLIYIFTLRLFCVFFSSQWQNVPGVRLRSSDPSWLQGNLTARLAVSPSMLSVSGGGLGRERRTLPDTGDYQPASSSSVPRSVELYPISPFISLPMMPCSAQQLLLMLHSHHMLKSADYLHSSVHCSEILRFKDGRSKWDYVTFEQMKSPSVTKLNKLTSSLWRLMSASVSKL